MKIEFSFQQTLPAACQVFNLNKTFHFRFFSCLLFGPKIQFCPAHSCCRTIFLTLLKRNVVYRGFRDTTRKSQKHELIQVVSRTISCSISEAPLNFISFLTVNSLWRQQRPLSCTPQSADMESFQ